MSKGQVTIFVVLGLVLLIIVGFFLFVLRESPINPTIEAPSDTATMFVQSCADGLLTTSLEYAAFRGGYIEKQPLEGVFGGLSIPVITELNDISKIEEGLEILINENIADCLDESDYPDFYVDQFSNHQSTVTIGQDSITLRGSFKYGTPIKEYSLKQNTNFMTLYRVANEVLNVFEPNTFGKDMMMIKLLNDLDDIQTEAQYDYTIILIEKDGEYFEFGVLNP
ncbi:MAG: hypothetical protein ABIB43_02365 [archaeon]